MFTPNTVASQVSKYMANAVTVSSIWGGIFYNVKEYGAKGDGTTSDSAKIADAITAASTNGGTVVFPPSTGTYIVNSNLTFPSNVTVEFSNGAKLSINTGITVTINGPINAGLYQIFSGLGTVAGSIKVPYLYPQWWGAKGDGVTDDTTAIQATINAANGASSPAVLLPKTSSYYNYGTLTVPTGVTILDLSGKTKTGGSLADFTTWHGDMFNTAPQALSSMFAGSPTSLMSDKKYVQLLQKYTNSVNPGVAEAVLSAYTKVGATANHFPWGISSIIDSDSPSGEHTGFYTEVRPTAGAPSWGLASYIKNTATTDAQLVGIEARVDNFRATPTQLHLGMDVINAGTGAKNDIGVRIGGSGGWIDGIRIGTISTDPLTNGINLVSDGTRGIWMQGTYTIGIEMAANNIRFGGGSLVWEATGTIVHTYNAGSSRIEWKNGAQVNAYLTNGGILSAPIAGIATKPNAGAPAPADGIDGSIWLDSTNGRIYVKYTGNWHYVTLTA